MMIFSMNMLEFLSDSSIVILMCFVLIYIYYTQLFGICLLIDNNNNKKKLKNFLGTNIKLFKRTNKG